MDNPSRQLRTTRFADRLHRIAGGDPTYIDQWCILETTLLGHGGHELVVPLSAETELDALNRTGELFGPTHRVLAGRPSQCHRNAAALWAAKPTWTYLTGYALTDDDGMWRQHSWLLNRTGQIIETTIRRDAYFGIRVPHQQLLATGLLYGWFNPTDLHPARVNPPVRPPHRRRSPAPTPEHPPAHPG